MGFKNTGFNHLKISTVNIALYYCITLMIDLDGFNTNSEMRMGGPQ